jgi:hypothetical protein
MMTSDDFQKARSFLLGLEGNAKVYARITTDWVQGGMFQLFFQEIQRIKAAFPSLLPACDQNTFYLRAGSAGNTLFSVVAITSYIETAIGRLRALIETESESIPLTERREFRFISDGKLRSILERDYGEMQRAFMAQCWKAVIILSGGGIEAILTDVLGEDIAATRAAKNAPNEADIRKWDLSHLIAVAVELRKVSGALEKLSSPVREYRNLVHPGVELRTGLTFGAEEARIALEVFHILHRDLSN